VVIGVRDRVEKAEYCDLIPKFTTQPWVVEYSAPAEARISPVAGTFPS